MSTKTTFKRISLVAVAALGFGVLSVVPSHAVALAITSTAVATTSPVATTAATPAAVGSQISATINLVQDQISTTAIHVIGNTYVLTDPNGLAVTSSATFTSGAVVGGVTTTNTANVYSHSLAIGSTAATKAVGTVTFTPTTAGVYVLTYTTANTTLVTDTNAVQTAATAASFYVTGSGAKVSASGIGTTTIGAISGGQAVVRFGTAAKTSGDIYNLTTSGVGSIQVVANGTSAPASIAGIAGSTDWTQGAKVTTSANTTFNDVLATVASTVAGTQTLTWTAISSTTGAPTVVATQAITWGAAATISTTNTTSLIDSTTATTFGTGTVDEALSVDGTVALTRLATIKVTLKDSSAVAMSAKTLSAVVTGPGLVQGGVGTGTLNAYTNVSGAGTRVATVATDALGQGFFAVFADGSGGVGTITISQGTTVVGVETITFAGIATQLKDNNVDADLVSLNKVYIGKGSTGTLSVGSYDVSGNKVSATPTGLVVTSDSTTVATVSISGGTGTITVTGVAVGKANITVSVGALATATIKLVLPVEITKTTAKTVTMSFDKATYAPGEKMTLTVKAVDSNGSGVADGARVLFSDTATANVALGTLPTGTVTLAGGIKTYTYYAPFAAGTITVTATEGAAVDAVIASTTAAPYTAAKITATATVVNASADAATDAANEATDAANAATDAALAAADAADAATMAAQDASDAVAALSASVSKLIASLKAQITSLTNLVIKIQKKVKA